MRNVAKDGRWCSSLEGKYATKQQKCPDRGYRLHGSIVRRFGRGYNRGVFISRVYCEFALVVQGSLQFAFRYQVAVDKVHPNHSCRRGT